ncbi:MAG: WS/DGAT/MGAT family O-acyltransferase [Solirubrobacteraceae bacterium]
MDSGDRLSGLDTSFLRLEDGRAHMHVASLTVFDGPAPAFADLCDHVEGRLDLVPRYRQRIAEVPAQQGRPVWVDDPHFNLRYHLRHTALPHPGGDEELRRLAGRVFAQRLDRDRPLWEIWMVEGLRDGRWAMLSKTHHALVDGVSGVDITTIMYDLDEHPPHRATAPSRWEPRPLPTKAQLLASAITERLVHPHAIFDEVVALTVRPRRAAEELLRQVRDLGAFALVGVRPVPLTPLNVQIGPHRRYTWVDADLAEFKQIKNHLGGTVNDVVLAAVAGALGRFLRRRGFDTDGVVLRAMVPVSVRTADERGALGNKVAAMWAPLPVGIEDPVDLLGAVRRSMGHLKDSGQAVGAQTLTELLGFAPPTILAQAMRLTPHQRYCNVVVTNVPGPQFPLYVLGHRLRALYPVVPVYDRLALNIAVLSYDGRLGFGLLGDYDAVPDLDDLADDLRQTIAGLLVAATGPLPERPRRFARSAGPA